MNPITRIDVGYNCMDFMNNKFSIVVTYYRGIFIRNIIITKPAYIFSSIGSVNARLKWILKISPRYYIRKYCKKSLKMVSRLKTLSK